jgi:hypothetical protein
MFTLPAHYMQPVFCPVSVLIPQTWGDCQAEFSRGSGVDTDAAGPGRTPHFATSGPTVPVVMRNPQLGTVAGGRRGAARRTTMPNIQRSHNDTEGPGADWGRRHVEIRPLAVLRPHNPVIMRTQYHGIFSAKRSINASPDENRFAPPPALKMIPVPPRSRCCVAAMPLVADEQHDGGALGGGVCWWCNTGGPAIRGRQAAMQSACQHRASGIAECTYMLAWWTW